EQSQQRLALDLRRNLCPEQLAERGHEIYRLGQTLSALSRLAGKIRVMNEKRNVRDFLVHRHAVLCPPVMLAEKETVVGGQDQRRILPHIVLVEIIENAAEQMITEAQKRKIVGPELIDLVLWFGHAFVARPVENRPVIVGWEHRLEPVRRKEGFVRIEGLDLKKPVVGRAVDVEEIEAGLEALH